MTTNIPWTGSKIKITLVIICKIININLMIATTS